MDYESWSEGVNVKVRWGAGAVLKKFEGFIRVSRSLELA